MIAGPRDQAPETPRPEGEDDEDQPIDDPAEHAGGADTPTHHTMTALNSTERHNNNDIRHPHCRPGGPGRVAAHAAGERCIIRVAAAETNGAYSVVERLSHPGDSTPMHVHQNEDEHFFILEGTARVVRGDETFDAPAGTTVALPRYIPHAWGNATTSMLRMIVTSRPGGGRSYPAGDSTRWRHRHQSPRREIRCPRNGSAAARGISERASALPGRAVSSLDQSAEMAENPLSVDLILRSIHGSGWPSAGRRDRVQHGRRRWQLRPR